MLDTTQVERLAAAANALRPDWPVKSLVTFLNGHTARPYRDVAVALAWVAADPTSQTPKRMNENGPWWRATSAEGGDTFERFRVQCSEHPGRKAGTCPDCTAAATPPPPHVVAGIRATLATTARPERADITHPRKATP